MWNPGRLDINKVIFISDNLSLVQYELPAIHAPLQAWHGYHWVYHTYQSIGIYVVFYSFSFYAYVIGVCCVITYLNYTITTGTP